MFALYQPEAQAPGYVKPIMFALYQPEAQAPGYVRPIMFALYQREAQARGYIKPGSCASGWRVIHFAFQLSLRRSFQTYQLKFTWRSGSMSQRPPSRSKKPHDGYRTNLP